MDGKNPAWILGRGLQLSLLPRVWLLSSVSEDGSSKTRSVKPLQTPSDFLRDILGPFICVLSALLLHTTSAPGGNVHCSVPLVLPPEEQSPKRMYSPQEARVIGEGKGGRAAESRHQPVSGPWARASHQTLSVVHKV